jgi:hypothetical protein
MFENKLLNTCFILKRKEDTRDDYFYIIQNQDIFVDYFDLLGYSIDVNESLGVISIRNIFGTGRLRLKKIESILLLILRLLSVEKRKEMSLNKDVIVLSDEIQQKYALLNLKTKTRLDKTMLKDTLRIFRKYNLISNLDSDVTLSDTRVVIYPSILFALSNDDVTDLYEKVHVKLTKYADGGEEPGYEETVQDQAD